MNKVKPMQFPLSMTKPLVFNAVKTDGAVNGGRMMYSQKSGMMQLTNKSLATRSKRA